MIHDGSSSPSLTLPHTMGEGEGGGRRTVMNNAAQAGYFSQSLHTGMVSAVLSCIDRKDWA